MRKVRQRDKDASLEQRSKPSVKTDTKRSEKKGVFDPRRMNEIISQAKYKKHEIKPLHESEKKKKRFIIHCVLTTLNPQAPQRGRTEEQICY